MSLRAVSSGRSGRSGRAARQAGADHRVPRDPCRQLGRIQAPGTLEGGSRFKPLASPLVLPPGSYTMVAYGYGTATSKLEYDRLVALILSSGQAIQTLELTYGSGKSTDTG